MFLWCKLILFCGRGGGEEWGSVISGGAQRGEVPLLGNSVLIAAAFVMTFFFPFSLVACCGARSWWRSDLALFRLGSEVQDPFPPPALKDQIHWWQYTAVGKRRLQMTSKTWFLCFQSKTIGGDASSQLSQRTGVYSSGYPISIWNGWEGRRGINRMMVLEVFSQICKYSIPDKFK